MRHDARSAATLQYNTAHHVDRHCACEYAYDAFSGELGSSRYVNMDWHWNIEHWLLWQLHVECRRHSRYAVTRLLIERDSLV